MSKNNKSSYMQRRQQEQQVNKKAIVWIGSIAVGVVVVLGLLMAFNVN